MIHPSSGDILAAPVEALVNTVNCVGVMGRGIALQFKNAFPDNYKQYAQACKREEVQPGRMYIISTGLLQGPRYIINFPTKRHWRGKSRLEDIETGLVDLVRVIEEHGITSIAIPPLGCGLGGLAWPVVKPLIEAALAPLNSVQIYLYAPACVDAVRPTVIANNAPAMTPGRAALIGLMHRYLEGLLDPFVSLLEVHKLMYFLQEANQQLKLRYVKAPYGPYAENLRNVLQAIEGHYIKGYGDGGDEPSKKLEIAKGAEQQALQFLSDHPDTEARFRRVSDLVSGFESPFGLELLATVHWLHKQEHPSSLSELVQLFHGWSPRKQQFSSRQIQIASAVLADQGWVDPLAESTTFTAGPLA
jgi:O-acetyl-ADP-ribose deacetylase (regulator of RNase III)